MKAFVDALNVVYDEKEKRSILRFYTTTFLFTLGGIGFAMVAITGVVVLPVILTFLGSTTTAEHLLAILRWPVLLVAVVLGLAVLYRYGPSRRDARWRWVTRAADRRQCYGSGRRWSSPGTWRASTATTEPTAPSAPVWAS